MGFYNNNVRADLYDQASKYVRRLIVMSRTSRSPASSTNAMPDATDIRAVCLEWDVQDVIRTVGRYVALLDPANVVAALKAVSLDDPQRVEKVSELLLSTHGKFKDLEFKPDGSLPMTSKCPR